MTHNLDATIYVYRHCETGTITALYSDDACAMGYRPDYEHVATLEPRMWIEHHFDDAIKEREACVDAVRECWTNGSRPIFMSDLEKAIRAQGNP